MSASEVSLLACERFLSQPTFRPAVSARREAAPGGQAADAKGRADVGVSPHGCPAHGLRHIDGMLDDLHGAEPTGQY